MAPSVRGNLPHPHSSASLLAKTCTAISRLTGTETRHPPGRSISLGQPCRAPNLLHVAGLRCREPAGPRQPKAAARFAGQAQVGGAQLQSTAELLLLLTTKSSQGWERNLIVRRTNEAFHYLIAPAHCLHPGETGHIAALNEGGCLPLGTKGKKTLQSEPGASRGATLTGHVLR